MTEAVLLGNSKSTGNPSHPGSLPPLPGGRLCLWRQCQRPAHIQCVATPIAMGGSPLAVQQAAVYTTGTVLENGIQQGLRHFGLI